MEGVGAEISQKIKSAIKAKLMEIGAFVDDELPDYIMVMVANKRTKAQMNDDLSLFLGSNTHHFTSWLHSVLEQLKQVTLISQNAKGKEPSKRKSSTNGDNANESERERKKKRKDSKDESDRPSSSFPGTDITDRIKQELISEFSKEKEAVIISQPPSDASSKNKRSFDISQTEPTKEAQPSKVTEVDLENSSEGPIVVKKEDAPPTKKAKNSSEVPKQASVEKEIVMTKEVVENGEKDDKEDREDSLSLELSSDENEYINIKNDDIFLSGDEEMPVYRHSSGKSISSKISEPKASDLKSSRRHSSSKETSSRREKSRSVSRSRDERKSKTHSSRDREPSSRDVERTSKLDVKPGSSKKVMDAREVLNWKRSLKQGSGAENEKSADKSSRNKSIFDRLSNQKTERSSEHAKDRSSERTKDPSGERLKERSSEQSTQRILSREHTRSKEETNRGSTRPNVNTLEVRSREKRLSDTQRSTAQLKRQVISISRIVESERELLRSAQKVAAVKPQVVSSVSSRILSSQSSKSQSRESSRNQSQSRRKEKTPEKRLASRVVAKEAESESDIEEITADVPSVVKITPRPVIPTAKAAPRNLILKAVAEAEKSIQSSPVRSEKLRSKERERETGKSKEKFSKKISPACISITLPNDRVGVQRDKTVSETRIDDSKDEEVNTRVRPSLEVFKKYQSSRGGAKISIRRSPSPENRRTINTSANKYDEEKSGDGDEEGDSIEFNISENSLPDEELDYEPHKEPSFIVTLNNLDPAIKARADSEESKVVNRVKPQRIYSDRHDDSSNETSIPIIHKAVSPVIISVSPSSPESNDESSLKKPAPAVSKPPVVTSVSPKITVSNKVADICKYWPNCLAGDSCPFVHITTPCVNFPNCKFGNRCLYSHPKCKFSSACVRKNCPYSHPVSSLPPSAPAVSSQTCKYFPQCTKIGCPYFHPKPCKFGANCMTKDCVFAHYTSGNKFKWSKSSSVQPLSVIL